MAVTATVWEEAHQYHRQCHSFLTLFSHGPGILTGLEVVASDPPETAVYILPGVAIDPAGRIIVVSQPVAYDIGRDMEGLLYLLLGYGESRPRADNGDQQEGAPLYITAEFSISAQTGLPDEPRVELARIRRSSRDSVFLDAPNPVRPGADEIDLRFRREVGAPPEITMAVCYLGQVTDQKQGVGAGFLAQAVNHMGRRYRVVVENDVPIGPNILPNTVVYLVGQGGFELDSGVMKGLRNYVVRRQGTLFIEGVDAEAENSFLTFLREQELLPAAVEAGHPLLLKPHLFNEPPPGFEPQTQTRLLAGDGIIFSPFNYGLMWQGAGPEGPAGREQIRTAIEWGENILTYALERRRGR
jgi:hypothetical protein